MVLLFLNQKCEDGDDKFVCIKQCRGKKGGRVKKRHNGKYKFGNGNRRMGNGTYKMGNMTQKFVSIEKQVETKRFQKK